MSAIAVACWAACGLLVLLEITQVAHLGDGRGAALAHSFTPYLLALALPLALVSWLLPDRAVLGVASLVALLLAGLLMRTARPPRRRDRPIPDPSSPVLTVLHSNVLFRNRRGPHEVADALLAVEADVLVVCEMTATLHTALDDHGALERYPHRIGYDGRRSEGLALWSRLPFVTTRAVHVGGRDALTVTVAVDGASFDVMALHAPTPTSHAHGDQWAPWLRAIAGLMRSNANPTLMVGDFNATRWHAPFRAILRAGYRDAHELSGRGFSTSWPIGARFVPPFVRLDHALVDPRLAPCSLRDLTIPGSDHRAFVVSVALAAR